jgi:hypothetical protein
MVRSKLHRNRMSTVGKAKSTEKEKLKPHLPNHRTPEHNLTLCSLGEYEPTPTQEKPNREISIHPSRILHFFHNTEKESGYFDMTQVQTDFTFPSYKLSFPSPNSGDLVPVLERGVCFFTYIHKCIYIYIIYNIYMYIIYNIYIYIIYIYIIYIIYVYKFNFFFLIGWCVG